MDVIFFIVFIVQIKILQMVKDHENTANIVKLLEFVVMKMMYFNKNFDLCIILILFFFGNKLLKGGIVKKNE